MTDSRREACFYAQRWWPVCWGLPVPPSAETVDDWSLDTLHVTHRWLCNANKLIWQKFLSLPALGASAYVQHHMVTWLYSAPGHQSTDHAVLRSLIRSFETLYSQLFASRQHWSNFNKSLSYGRETTRGGSTISDGGGSIWGYYRLKSYFSRYCDMTQFTLTHHMVNKPFLLLGLAAEYRSRRRRCWCDKHCGQPSDVYNTDRWTKLTALETISRWLLLNSLFEPPFRALRGNVRTPSMARWKANGRLYIRCNWTFFAIS